MDEMMKAITRAANAVAAYYEKQVGMTTTVSIPLPAEEPQAAVAEPKVRKPRAVKAETRGQDNVPGEPETSRPAPVAPVEMSEAESTEKLKVVGEAFVQRFSKQGDAVDEVKKLIESKFKVVRLRDLVHPQRVELIAVLESRIKELDSRQTQASVPAPVGLGL